MFSWKLILAAFKGLPGCTGLHTTNAVLVMGRTRGFVSHGLPGDPEEELGDVISKWTTSVAVEPLA